MARLTVYFSVGVLILSLGVGVACLACWGELLMWRMDPAFAFVRLLEESSAKGPKGQSDAAFARLERMLKHFPDLSVQLSQRKVSPYRSVSTFVNESDYEQIVSLFVKHSLDINEVDAFGDSPIYYAISHKKTALVDVMLQHGADPFRDSTKSASLLRFSYSDRNPKMFHLLMNVEPKPEYIQEELLDVCMFFIGSFDFALSADDREQWLELLKILCGNFTGINKKHELRKATPFSRALRCKDLRAAEIIADSPFLDFNIALLEATDPDVLRIARDSKRLDAIIERLRARLEMIQPPHAEAIE